MSRVGSSVGMGFVGFFLFAFTYLCNHYCLLQSIINTPSLRAYILQFSGSDFSANLWEFLQETKMPPQSKRKKKPCSSLEKLKVTLQATVTRQGRSFATSGLQLTPQIGCFLFSLWMGSTSPNMLPCSILILQATSLPPTRNYVLQVLLQTTDQDSGDSRTASGVFYTTASSTGFPPCPSAHMTTT